MPKKPPGWTVEDMHELGTRHAALEAKGDLEATMATLVDEPVYEFWPLGLSMKGEAPVRRYYERCVERFADNPNVRVEHLGLSDVDEERTIYKAKHNYGANSVLREIKRVELQVSRLASRAGD